MSPFWPGISPIRGTSWPLAWASRFPIRWPGTWRMFEASRHPRLATLDELRPAWRAVGAHLQTTLTNVTAAALAEPKVHRLPIQDASRLGLIAFLLQHDSYYLGQVAFLRRQLGKPPMSYACSDIASSSAGAA